MERRRALRIPMAASWVQVMNLGHWTRAALVDLSLCGAQLCGDHLPAEGLRARLQLSFDGHAVGLETLAVWRHIAGRYGALDFDPLSSTQRHTIAIALLRAGSRVLLEGVAIMLALDGSPRLAAVVDESPGRRFTPSAASVPVDVTRPAQPAVSPMPMQATPASRDLIAAASADPESAAAESAGPASAGPVPSWPWNDDQEPSPRFTVVRLSTRLPK